MEKQQNNKKNKLQNEHHNYRHTLNEDNINDICDNGSSIITQIGDTITPMLSEDYAEIGLGEDEGDYSTPAGKFIYY